MPTSIDLRKAHLHRNYGDLVAVFSWINDERALFLIPRFRKGAPWFIVMEPAAHEWSDQSDFTNIPLVVRRAYKACEVLGIEPNKENCHRIVGIVNDAIQDLVRMPSAPPMEYHRTSYGQLQIRADGQVIGGEDIRMADEGAQYAVH